jgi:hypothetical protein
MNGPARPAGGKEANERMNKKPYTLEQAQTFLAQAHEARRKALEAQSYGLGRRSVARASLKDILDEIRYWEDYIEAFNNPSGRFRRAVVRDR